MLRYCNREGKEVSAEEGLDLLRGDCNLARDKIGDSEVSTVFLVVDHDYYGGWPILFETMIFGGPWDSFTERYHTEQEAREGHARVVAQLRAGESPEIVRDFSEPVIEGDQS